MKKTKIEPNQSANDSKTEDDISVENSGTENAGRRLKDTLASKNTNKNRKMNLDRRVVNNERRVSAGSNYNGPARRNTIDRRLNLKDRRDED